jgi:hypothetical protein
VSHLRWHIKTLVARNGGLRRSLDELVPIEDAKPFRRFLNAIDGAICISIDGEVLSDESHWDHVDCLWADLINALEEVEYRNTDTDQYFPDQPIRLALQRVGDRQLRLMIGEKSANVPRREFGEFLMGHALNAMNRFAFLDPSKADGHSDYANRADNLLRYIRGSK